MTKLKDVSDMVVPAITIVAGVVVFSKILPLVGGTEGLQKAIADLWAFLKGVGGGGGNGQLQMEFSRTPHDFLQGESIGIAVGGLLPNTQVDYLWSTIGKIDTVTTDSTGSVTLSNIFIDYSTAPGTYTVTFDQRPYGGTGISNTLRVLDSGMKLNTYTVKRGDPFTVTAAGLKPGLPVLYGWKSPISVFTNLQTNENGGLVFYDTVLETTPPGTYTVYVNQNIPFVVTGKYFEQRFKVI